MDLTLDAGDSRVARVTFRNEAGNLYDPAEVTIHVKPPRGAAVAYTLAAAEVARESLGVFKRTISFPEAGRWIIKGRSPEASTEPTNVNVRHDPFSQP